ncbi:rhodanese-like domain-containing protein [Halalkalibaculum sp. DA3122]|uniref:rhodanese-like domain-containing protein n=1 Tax=Halalkalibaculum sp. DA3122 TaxID=3373607 RepID=UPI0037542DC2
MNKPILIIALIGIAVVMAITLFSNTESTQESNQVMDISPTEFLQKKDQQPGIVIDVRTQKEYDAGHLAEADRHYDLLNGDFEAQLNTLDKNETYYLYCRSGNRSGKAAQLMVENGFENVYNIGGFEDLVSAGLESN